MAVWQDGRPLGLTANLVLGSDMKESEANT